MPRNARAEIIVEDLVEEYEQPRSLLADAWAEHDARAEQEVEDRKRRVSDVRSAIDACADPWMAEAIYLPLAQAFYETLTPRRDPRVRWPDVKAALHAWFYADDKGRFGVIGRQCAQLETGTVGTGSPSAQPRTPDFDSAIEVVRRALATMEPEEREMLVQAYVELQPPRPNRNREGRKIEGGIGAGSAFSIAATARKTGATTQWFELVADERGLPMDEEHRDDSCERVRASVKRAAKKLSTALRLVELDGAWRARCDDGEEHALTRDEGIEWETGKRKSIDRGTQTIAIVSVAITAPRFLIPPLAARERRREMDVEQPGKIVETCGGAEIAGGVRLGCSTGYAPEEDTAACPRCEACGRPRS